MSTSWPWLAVPGVALFLRLAGGHLADIGYVLLGVYAFRGRAEAVQALALSWLFTMLNPGIASPAAWGDLDRYVVISGAALSVVFHSGLIKGRSMPSGLASATLALGVLIGIHSLLFSPLPVVSIAKALSWTVVMATLLSAWGGMSSDAANGLARWLFRGLLVLTAISVPLAFAPLGYLRNGHGFQGVFGQPQVFGLTTALLGAWIAGRLLAAVRPTWVDVLGSVLCVALVVMSESRTAGASLLLGVFTTLLILPRATGRPARRLMPGLLSRRVHALMLIGVAGLAMVGPALVGHARDYVFKGADVTSLRGAAELSREGLVETMIANITEHPMTGIGFGIASDPSSMNVDRDPLFGFPVGASVEKGVWPIAVFEELGILGALLVAVWLWLMIRRASYGGVVPFTVLMTLLATNLGESTLFSPGGEGLLLLILLAWTATVVRGKDAETRSGPRVRDLVLAKNAGQHH